MANSIGCRKGCPGDADRPRLKPLALAGVAAAALGVAGCTGADSSGKPGECGTGRQAAGTICRWAGTGDPAFNGDGLTRLETALYWPVDLEFAADGQPYLIDWQNHRIRRVTAEGRLQTVVGDDFPGDGPPDNDDFGPPGVPGTAVSLNHPTDMAFRADGQLVFAAWHNHKLRQWDPASGLEEVVLGRGPGGSGDGGPARLALAQTPKALVIDNTGNLFFTDAFHQRIRRIDAQTGIVTTVAGTGQVGTAIDVPPLQAQFFMQQLNENAEPGASMAMDAQGRIYLADTFNHRVVLVDLDAQMVSLVAGTGEAGYAGDGGPAVAAQFNQPKDLELGPDGRLYVADTNNHRVRAIDLNAGSVVTVVGGGSGASLADPMSAGDGGQATAAILHRPWGIAFDAAGELYVADTNANVVRKVVLP